ncbi:hypothetical protein EWP20_10825 [Neisseria meningitidis]|nr:hypothetical protein [Neisseria meningitidis]MBG8594616.1 hypothetical protein [Neisseria meningitidis]MBG8603377.1 hypothetical protein [Neisseria meningitidis]MBG8605725.1 hypothetical protein [Neisseria meningitidis]MBG8609146.1 hypothetical protein [Neisseria meningitidis]
MNIHRISFSVETSPLGHLSFGAAGSDFIWEERNPFQIRATHRAVLYMSSCVLKHLHFFLKQGYLKQRTG